MLTPISYNLEESGVVCYTTNFFLKLHSYNFNINLCIKKVLWFSLTLYKIRDKVQDTVFIRKIFLIFRAIWELPLCVSPDLSGGFLKVAEGNFHPNLVLAKCPICLYTNWLMIGLVRFENSPLYKNKCEDYMV